MITQMTTYKNHKHVKICRTFNNTGHWNDYHFSGIDESHWEKNLETISSAAHIMHGLSTDIVVMAIVWGWQISHSIKVSTLAIQEDVSLTNGLHWKDSTAQFCLKEEIGPGNIYMKITIQRCMLILRLSPQKIMIISSSDIQNICMAQ